MPFSPSSSEDGASNSSPQSFEYLVFACTTTKVMGIEVINSRATRAGGAVKDGGGTRELESKSEETILKPKLKPLHWDQGRASFDIILLKSSFFFSEILNFYTFIVYILEYSCSTLRFFWHTHSKKKKILFLFSKMIIDFSVFHLLVYFYLILMHGRRGGGNFLNFGEGDDEEEDRFIYLFF